MIYLDNAATSYPKPRVVLESMTKYLEEYGANPGRGAYGMAIAASRMVFDTREELARFFGVDDSRNIIFTLNGTEAINLGLKGFLKPGDHVVTTNVEHNSVTRPLRVLAGEGVSTTKVNCSGEGSLNPDDVKKALQKNTKLIVLTHASNVIGTILPLKEVGKIAGEHGIAFMVDAAQTAGIVPIDVKALNIGLLAFPGHKALMGPPGTGGLYIDPDLELKELIHGGTGEDSRAVFQPLSRPERYESGTLNAVGIAGFGAALRFIREIHTENIWKKEKKLVARLIRKLKEIDSVEVYGTADEDKRVPLVSFNVAGKTGEEVCYLLDKEFGIAARAGLHCAPEAHEAMGTLEKGAVRFSLGHYNTAPEIDEALEAVTKISQMSLKQSSFEA